MGVAADMCDPHRYTVTIEEQIFGVLLPDGETVDVSVHSTQGFVCGDLLCDLDRTDIPCVPDLIAIGEHFEDLRIESAVGV